MNMPELKNPTLKNFLSAIAVAVFGFVLLILTFIFDAAYQGIVRSLIRPFLPANLEEGYYWYPMLMHGSFVIVIGIISWFVFRSRLSTLLKAIFMTVPLAVVFVTIGIFTYQWPAVSYILGGLCFAGVLLYLYRTRQPWLYYYTLALVGCAILMVGILGIEI